MIREGVGFFVSLDALFRYPLPAVIYYRGSAPVRRVPFFACPKQGTERKGTPDSAPRMVTPHAGFPRSALVSDGPRKGLSSLPLSLLRSKDRCASSVVRPLAGAGIHWIPAFLRLAPVSGPDARNPFRARSGPLFAFLGAWLGERRPTKTNTNPTPLGPSTDGDWGGFGCAFRPPYSSRGRRESEVQARRGGARVKRIKTKVQWVSRNKASVRWTLVPANAQAMDGLGRCPSAAGSAQPQGLSR